MAYFPPRARPAVSRTRTSWDVELGGLRFGITRTRETQTAGDAVVPTRAARPAWPLAIGAFAGVSALGLAVMGATAAVRPDLPARYMVSMPVPALAPPPRAHHVHRPAPVRTGAAAVSPADARDGFAAGDAPYVARALRTGAFQEWSDADGQHRFLTAGPGRAGADGKTCRDLALLVRLADGGSHVHAAQRCTAEPVSDAASAAQEDEGEPSGSDAPTRP
ncbi:hypothetical protein [uncultured Sphingomonas sp.]|uniref:hypothetical protein n=1 Tax=uncultured Sphingomonas sp. TaxID=158754 RepID=UPI0035C958AF